MGGVCAVWVRGWLTSVEVVLVAVSQVPFGQPRGKFGKGWLARGSPGIVSASGVTFLNTGLSSMMLTGCRQLCPVPNIDCYKTIAGSQLRLRDW